VGGGFWYLLALDLGLRVGIDVARGPEEWAFYLQVGSAEMRQALQLGTPRFVSAIAVLPEQDGTCQVLIGIG
jgi:hypothetical protein